MKLALTARLNSKLLAGSLLSLSSPKVALAHKLAHEMTMVRLIDSKRPEMPLVAPKPAVWAEYLGWQESGKGRGFPLFNVHGNHPLAKSTVGIATLQKNLIPVPRYKDPR